MGSETRTPGSAPSPPTRRQASARGLEATWHVENTSLGMAYTNCGGGYRQCVICPFGQSENTPSSVRSGKSNPNPGGGRGGQLVEAKPLLLNPGSVQEQWPIPASVGLEGYLGAVGPGWGRSQFRLENDREPRVAVGICHFSPRRQPGATAQAALHQLVVCLGICNRPCVIFVPLYSASWNAHVSPVVCNL